jgi:protein DJ-1
VIVLPGGATGAKTFSSDKEVLKLIRDFRNADARVAAICAATTALVASVEDGKGESGEGVRKARVTSHPSVKKAIVEAGWDYADEKERVVVDGKVITSRGLVLDILSCIDVWILICLDPELRYCSPSRSWRRSAGKIKWRK